MHLVYGYIASMRYLSLYFGKCPTAVQEAKRQFDVVQAVMVSQLRKGRAHIYWEVTFTAVDILYIHCLDWAKSIGWFTYSQEDEENGKDDDALGVYLQLCHSRPAYQRTLAKQTAEEQAEKDKKQRCIVSKL